MIIALLVLLLEMKLLQEVIFINKDNWSINYSFTGKYNYDSTNFENYLFSWVTIDKTGVYSISLNLTNNFGLIGYYYQNVDFHNLFNQKDLKYHPTLYSKYCTRKDEKIDFSLVYYSFMNNYHKLKSVIWEGFLKPDSSETYTITFEDQSRIIVYIDNKLAISYCDTKNSKISSFITENYVNIALDTSIYTHIKILYIKDEDVFITVLRMYWESDIVEKQIIPKYNLYSDLYNSEIPLTVKNADTSPNTLTIITENYNEKCSLNGVSTFSFQI